ncbi:MAG: HAD-IA family hydrolase [Candidatus Omnitrophica bacterium]|nr:HAD-IA family hydrolase [Candidatus Omnitrophota bacterium]
MTKNKYEAIFCDLGNVLINFDHRIAVKKILTNTKKNEHDIYQLFFDSGLTKDYEEGKVSSSDFFKKVRDSLNLDIGNEKLLPIWNDIFFETPLNKKIQAFLAEVKEKYKLVMISNINETHWEFLKNKIPVFSKFDKLILSYKVGFRKPAIEIYNAALESVKTSPSKAFYIDDRKDLIEAALQFGIKGMAFEGEEAFRKIRAELI